MLLTWQNTNANAFNPLNTPANLAALYLPGTGQTNVSGACSQWDDQSGNARHLAQGTGGARPTINADGSLTFDGTADFMRVAFTLNQPTVITILVNLLTETTSAWRAIDGAAAINTGGILQNFPAGGQIQSFAGSFGPIATVSVATLQVWQILFNGASSSLRINNGAAVVADAGAANMGGITLGADGAAVPTTFANIRAYGMSVRSAADANVNAQDRAFWLRIGGIS